MTLTRLLLSLSGFGLVLGSAACSSDDAPERRDTQVEPSNDDAPSGDDGDGQSTRRDAGSPSSSQRLDAGAADASRNGPNPMSAGRDASSAMPHSDAQASEPSADAGAAPAVMPDAGALKKFSFFVTSLKAMVDLSGSQHGFGGDLRFGETGEGAGIRGADKICSTIAEKSMQGAGAKGWRAFLSATKDGPNGGPVHAIDRVGEGPWYDRLGRLVAMNKAELMMTRPASADPAIKNDLPNEDGVPNHNPDGTGEVDNHDILTGSNDKGQLYRDDPRVTCNDWTKSAADANDAPRVGHSWPRMGFGGRRPPGGGGAPPGGGFPIPDGGLFPGGGSVGQNFNPEHWISSLDEAGCGPGVFVVEMGPPMESNPTVGSGGGYGGIYCFALMP